MAPRFEKRAIPQSCTVIALLVGVAGVSCAAGDPVAIDIGPSDESVDAGTAVPRERGQDGTTAPRASNENDGSSAPPASDSDEENDDSGSPPSSGEAGQDAGVSRCAHRDLQPDQIVMIGDSFYDFTEIPERLWDLARAAALLGPLETYRYYYKSGAMMVGGLITPIPEQYEQARTTDPDIVEVIMNGGGNDVLIGDRSCLTQAPPENVQCAQTIERAVDAAATLFTRMRDDGVEHVIYAFYPHMPTFGLFQGYAPAINDTIDYAQEKARAACEASVAPRCYFVSTREAFEGHPEYLNAGDVHASPEGSRVAARLIWDAMVAHCVAQ